MPSKSIIVLLSFLAFSCGDGTEAQIDSLGSDSSDSKTSDEFVNTIATRITDLGGGADLLTNYAEYEQLKRASEDQFFEKQLQRIVEYSPNAGIRDQEKKRSLADFDSSKVTLCRQSSQNGYLGSEGEEESFGFCGGNTFVEMSSEDFVRFLSYTLKAEKSNDPIRQITSVRLNKKVRLIFEEQMPLYHVILGERQRGAFKLGSIDMGSNGLENGLQGILASAAPVVMNTAPSNSDDSPDKARAESTTEKEVVEVKPEAIPEPKPEPVAASLPNLDNLVTSYLDLQEGTDIAAIMRLYDDRVQYNNKGTVSKSIVRQDKLSYFKRWPARNHQRLSSVTVKKGASADTHTARFNYSYDLSDGKNKANGKVWMELTIKESSGAYLITKERGGSL